MNLRFLLKKLCYQPVTTTQLEQLQPALIDPAQQAQWLLFERIRFHGNVESNLRQHRLAWFQKPSMLSVKYLEELKVETLLNAIYELSENGGEIHLPQGRLEFKETLNLPTNISLIGNHTHLVFHNVRFGIALIGKKEQPIHHVTLENITISHTGTSQFSAAIFISQSTDICLKNINVIAPQMTGFLLADGVKRVSLNQCNVISAGLGGFMLVRDVTDCIFEQCKAEHCQQSGIFLTDLKLPEHLDPLDFDGQLHYTSEIIGNFAPFSPTDLTPVRNTLSNCVFRGNRKMGITTDGVGFLRVINCVIAENDCEGITIDNGSWGCQIQHCHIYRNGWRGLQHDVELTQDFVQEMGLLSDGSSKAKLPGVSLDNAAYTRVENNIIEGNWGDGVKFVRAGYRCYVGNNLIIDNNRGMNDRFHFFGVLIAVATRQHPEQFDFPSCYNVVKNNDILGLHYSGIHLLPNTIGNEIKDNKIDGFHCLAIEDHSDIGTNFIT